MSHPYAKVALVDGRWLAVVAQDENGKTTVLDVGEGCDRKEAETWARRALIARGWETGLSPPDMHDRKRTN